MLHAKKEEDNTHKFNNISSFILMKIIRQPKSFNTLNYVLGGCFYCGQFKKGLITFEIVEYANTMCDTCIKNINAKMKLLKKYYVDIFLMVKNFYRDASKHIFLYFYLSDKKQAESIHQKMYIEAHGEMMRERISVY